MANVIKQFTLTRKLMHVAKHGIRCAFDALIAGNHLTVEPSQTIAMEVFSSSILFSPVFHCP